MTDPGDGGLAPAGRVFTMPAAWPFADCLAAGLLAEADRDPLILARATILLPTRRAVRTVRDAFLRAAGGTPLLLPRLVPVGDLDADSLALTGAGDDLGLGAPSADRGTGAALDPESPDTPTDPAPPDSGAALAPPVGPVTRRLILARLILARGDMDLSLDQALGLADSLAALIDEVATENLSFARLQDLAPAALASHWQITVEFLSLATAAWPAVLAERGEVDPANHRNRVLAAQIAAWQAAPPADPVILAGVTGSIPAVGDLAAAVLSLPAGRIVLPGLDRLATADDAPPLDDTHPQADLARLLARLAVPAADVADWPHPPPAADLDRRPDRSALIRELFRPAGQTDRWQTAPALPSAVLSGLTAIDCADEREEAAIVALLLREALEKPGRTAALVTPDRTLGRRVATIVDRWGIAVDDSAGVPLDQTAVGTFLRLIADTGFQRLRPVKLLALLKHPLTALGRAPAEARRFARLLERLVLRGPRPQPGAAALRHAIEKLPHDTDRRADRRAALLAEFDRLVALLSPFLDALAGREIGLDALLVAHLGVAEALAATDDTDGAARLWREEDGEALATLLTDLRLAGDDLPMLDGDRYPQTFDRLLAGQVVRPRYGRHPRLQIMGPFEARLQQPDLVIAAGLNEGTWPAAAPPDPWMSRPMRAAFGLPSRDRRIGQAAHDLSQLMAAPRVVLTRAARVAGVPTVRSRWLLRLGAVLPAVSLADALPRGEAVRGWADRLDAADRVQPCKPPRPTPPRAARPDRLFVTRIETLIHDPYAIFARFVLGLKPLDPLEQEPGPRDRGILIHEALDRALKTDPAIDWRNGAAATEAVLSIGRAVFRDHDAWNDPEVRAFWWPRFARAAKWFAQTQAIRLGRWSTVGLEVTGEWAVPGSDPPFRLGAKADRIDRDGDGRLAIIDYKTGQPPTKKEVVTGVKPQLPLEAIIAAAGGFREQEDGPFLPAAPVSEISHWHLAGSATQAGKAEAVIGEELAAAIAAAEVGIGQLVTRYQDPATPYLSTVRPARRVGDYDHLARLREWSSGSGEEGA